MSSEISELQRLWLLVQSERTEEGKVKFLCDMMFPIFSKLCTSSSSIAYKLTFGDGRALTNVLCRAYGKVADPTLGVNGINTVMASQHYAILLSYLSTLLEPEYYRVANAGDESRVEAILADIRIHMLRHDIFKIMLTLHNIFLEAVHGQTTVLSDGAVAAEQTHLALIKSLLEACDGKVLAEAAGLRCFQSIMSTLMICYRFPFRGSSSLTRMASDVLDTILDSEGILSVLTNETILLSEEENIFGCLHGDVRRSDKLDDSTIAGQKLSTLSHCIHTVQRLRSASHSPRAVRYETFIECFLSLQSFMPLHRSLIEGVFEEYLKFAFTNITVIAPKKKEKGGIAGIFGLKKKIVSIVFTKEEALQEKVHFDPDCLLKAVDFVKKSNTAAPRLWLTSRLCDILMRVDEPGGPDGNTSKVVLYDLCQRGVQCEAELLKKILGALGAISQRLPEFDLSDILSCLSKYLEEIDPPKQELVVRFFTTLATGNNQQLLQKTGEFSVVVATCKMINDMSASVDTLDDALIDVAETIFCLWKILLLTDMFVADFVKGMSLHNLVKCTLARTHKPSNIKFIVASRNALVSLIQQRKESVSVLLEAISGLTVWEKDTTAHAVNLAVAIYGGHCHEEVIAQKGLPTVLSLLSIVSGSTNYAFNLHVISFILSMLMPCVRWTEPYETLRNAIPSSLVNTMEMVRFILVVGCGLGVQSQILSIMLDACYGDKGDPSIQAVLCIEESPPQTQLCELEQFIHILAEWYTISPSPEVHAALTWMVCANRTPICDETFCALVLSNRWEAMMPFVGSLTRLIEMGGVEGTGTLVPTSDAEGERVRAVQQEIADWHTLVRPFPARHAITFLGNGCGGALGRLEFPTPSWPPMNGLSVCGWFFCSYDENGVASNAGASHCVPFWRLKWHYGGDTESVLSLVFDTMGQALILTKEGGKVDSIACSTSLQNQWVHVCVVMHRWHGDATIFINGSAKSKQALEYPVVVRQDGMLVTNRCEVSLAFHQASTGRRNNMNAQSLSLINFQVYDGPLLQDHIQNLVAAPFHVRDSSVLAASGAASLSLTAPVLTNTHLRRLSNADLNTLVRQAANGSANLRVRVPEIPTVLSFHATAVSRATPMNNNNSNTTNNIGVATVMRFTNMMQTPCNCALHGRYSAPPADSGSPVGSFLAHKGPEQWIEWLEQAELVGKKSVVQVLGIISECLSEGLEVSSLIERDQYYKMASIINRKARFFTCESDVEEADRVGILNALCSVIVRTTDGGRFSVICNGPLTEMLFLNWAFLSKLQESAVSEILAHLNNALNGNNPFHKLNAWRLRKFGFIEGFVCCLARNFVLPRILGAASEVISRFIHALLWDQTVLSEIATFLAASVPRSMDYTAHLSKLSSTLPINFFFHIESSRNVILDALSRAVTSASNAGQDVSGALPPYWFVLMTSEYSHPVTAAISMSIFSSLFIAFGSFRTRCAKANVVRTLQGTLSHHATHSDVLCIVANLVVGVATDVCRTVPSVETVSTRGQSVHAVIVSLLLHLIKHCGLKRSNVLAFRTQPVASYMQRFSPRQASSGPPKRYFLMALRIMAHLRRQRKEVSPIKRKLTQGTERTHQDGMSRLVALLLRFIAKLVVEHESVNRLFFAKEGSSIPLSALSWCVIASMDAPTQTGATLGTSCDSVNSDFDMLDEANQTLLIENIPAKYPNLLEASLSVYAELMKPLMGNFEAYTSNTFSVKSCEVVYWLHTSLCACPAQVDDRAKAWFQTKLLESWMSECIGITRRVSDANTPNRSKNCHQLGLYALERFSAGFSVPPRPLNNFLKLLRSFTSNSDIIKSIDTCLFDMFICLSSESYHSGDPVRAAQGISYMWEFREIFAKVFPTALADIVKPMFRRILEMCMVVIGQRSDGDLPVMTNDELLVVNLCRAIMEENRAYIMPIFMENAMLGAGFEKIQQCRSQEEKTAFVMWLYAHAKRIRDLLSTFPSAEQRFVVCLPKRVQGWSQRSEDELQTERNTLHSKMEEAERAVDVWWSRHAFAGSAVDSSLLRVEAALQFALRPFVVYSPSQREAHPTVFTSLGGVPSSALDGVMRAHLLQNGAVPLGVLMSHSGDGCIPLHIGDPANTDQSTNTLLRPTAQRIMERVLDGCYTEVRGAPVLWAGNVYHVTGNESLICFMTITSFEVVIISSSQLTSDGSIFISSLETHEANKASQKKGAIVENVIRRFLPKAPIPSSLSSASLSTFRHSQYFRQLRTEAKAVQRDSYVWRFPLAMLSTAHHRHFQHEAAAVEFVLEDATRLFVVFMDKDLVMSREARQTVMDLLSVQAPHVTIDTNTAKRSRVASAQKKWLKRQISNYDYLLTINDAASRTFAELTQYPVMPWVLACYNELFIDLDHDRYYRDLSWPLGALDETRRKEVIGRYTEWLDDSTPPFHYGTHYSTSAIVMYYLVRLQPLTSYAMVYQGGKLDVADRLFHSIEEAWTSCSSATGRDVKELIPEFFSLQHFLLNRNEIDLGTRRDGVTLDNVQLPYWATSTASFIYTNREALESDKVSSAIHNWIDLIFGFKQEGEAAVQACNVFHHLTYASGFEEAMTSAASEEDRKAIVASVDNFGLTPKAVFKAAHPKRQVLHPFRSHSEYFQQAIAQLQLRSAAGHVCDPQCSGQPVKAISELEGQLVISSFNRRTTTVKPLQHFILDISRSLVLNYRTKDQCTTMLPSLSPFGIGHITALDTTPTGNTVFIGSSGGSVVVCSRSSWTSRHSISHILHVEKGEPVSLLSYLGSGRLIVGAGSSVSLWNVTRRGVTHQWSSNVYRHAMGDSSAVIAAVLCCDALDAVLLLKERSIYVVVEGEVVTAVSITASVAGMSTFTSVAYFNFSSHSQSNTFCCGHSDGRVSFWSLTSDFKPKGNAEGCTDIYEILHITSRQIDVQSEASAITCLLPQPNSFGLLAGCRNGALWSVSLPQGLVDNFNGGEV